MLGQLYTHWELCIADDCSPDREILCILATYQRKDPRIKVVRRDRNGNIAAASNSALALPDLMRGQNMISHLGVYRRSLLTSIGGFRLGYEGSQDYDLALRAVERTTPERIRHIPHVLTTGASFRGRDPCPPPICRAPGGRPARRRRTTSIVSEPAPPSAQLPAGELLAGHLPSSDGPASGHADRADPRQGRTAEPVCQQPDGADRL